MISGEAGTTDNLLRWDIGGQTQWSTQLQAGTWYNFAYDIDFGSGTCGLWQSTGSAALTQVKSGISCSANTNSADWHVGQLRLPNGGTNPAAEDWYWSGIFIEQAPITTSIAGPQAGSGGTAPPPTSSSSSITSVPTSSSSSTSKPVSTTTSSTTTAGPVQTQWGQCGGNGYS